jgi:hypothetical protein
MTRFTPMRQVAILRGRKRYDNFVKLLDSYDWKSEGYADKFAWLRDMYGHGHDQDLLAKCHQQFEQEGLL